MPCQSQVQSDFGNPAPRIWNSIGTGPDNIWDLLPVAAISDILGEWTKTLGAGCWRGQDISTVYLCIDSFISSLTIAASV